MSTAVGAPCGSKQMGLEEDGGAGGKDGGRGGAGGEPGTKERVAERWEEDGGGADGKQSIEPRDEGEEANDGEDDERLDLGPRLTLKHQLEMDKVLPSCLSSLPPFSFHSSALSSCTCEPYSPSDTAGRRESQEMEGEAPG